MPTGPGEDQSPTDVVVGEVGREVDGSGRALVCSLVPWAAFMVATAAIVPWVEHRSLEWGAFVGSAAGSLLFVALPSALPLVFARPGWMRATILVLLTAIAVWAGVLVVVTDDAQAGLAVLWVPYLAAPLTIAAVTGRCLRARLRSRS